MKEIFERDNAMCEKFYAYIKEWWWAGLRACRALNRKLPEMNILNLSSLSEFSWTV